MIPLALVALLGLALTAYEFSPRARARLDDYARAIRDAHAAHLVADAHLSTATVAATMATQHSQAAASSAAAPAPTPPPAPPPVPMPPPAPVAVSPAPAPPPAPPPQTVADAHADAAQAATDAGIDHVVAATEANQAAAKSTAEAAKTAASELERAAAAASAAKVVERARQIAAALAALGVGQCGVHSYVRVTPQIKDKLIARLHSEGMDVTGSNPWDIETHQYDVKLRAIWDPSARILKIVVTSGKGGYFGLVTCDEIWKKIDPIMKDVIG